MSEPDFFLASNEGYDLERPRRCWRVRRLRSDFRDDFLLVRIDPPLRGQKYNLGAQDIDTVILAARHVGASLFPISEWPIAVHVARTFAAVADNRAVVHDEEFESIAWAELYPTEADAENKRV
jgi:hypothetical protein